MFVTVFVVFALTTVNCADIGCTSRSSPCIGKGITFNQIPTDKKKPLRQQWIHNIHYASPLLEDTRFYIWSVHFEETSFKQNLKIFLVKLDIAYCKRY